MVMLKLKENESRFQQFIMDYFERREQLVCAFVLIDIRLEARKIDLEFMGIFRRKRISIAINFYQIR